MGSQLVNHYLICMHIFYECFHSAHQSAQIYMLICLLFTIRPLNLVCKLHIFGLSV